MVVASTRVHTRTYALYLTCVGVFWRRQGQFVFGRTNESVGGLDVEMVRRKSQVLCSTVRAVFYWPEWVLVVQRDRTGVLFSISDA